MFFGTAEQDCQIKTKEMLSFLTLINNAVTIGLRLLLLRISAITLLKKIKFYVFYLDCIL